MPVYTYKCTGCKREVDVRLSVFEECDLKCSTCDGDMTKVISPPFVVSKLNKDSKVGQLTNKMIEESRKELQQDRKAASNKDYE